MIDILSHDEEDGDTTSESDTNQVNADSPSDRHAEWTRTSANQNNAERIRQGTQSLARTNTGFSATKCKERTSPGLPTFDDGDDDCLKSVTSASNDAAENSYKHRQSSSTRPVCDDEDDFSFHVLEDALALKQDAVDRIKHSLQQSIGSSRGGCQQFCSHSLLLSAILYSSVSSIVVIVFIFDRACFCCTFCSSFINSSAVLLIMFLLFQILKCIYHYNQQNEVHPLFPVHRQLAKPRWLQRQRCSSRPCEA